MKKIAAISLAVSLGIGASSGVYAGAVGVLTGNALQVQGQELSGLNGQLKNWMVAAEQSVLSETPVASADTIIITDEGSAGSTFTSTITGTGATFTLTEDALGPMKIGDTIALTPYAADGTTVVDLTQVTPATNGTPVSSWDCVITLATPAAEFNPVGTDYVKAVTTFAGGLVSACHK